jgi:hypothetical protein
VMNVGELINLTLSKTTVSTWDTLTKGIEWLIVIHLVREHGSGQRNYFSPLGSCSIEYFDPAQAKLS